MNNLSCKHQKGFSIIESVIAVSLLGAIVILFSYFSSSRLSQIVSQEEVACVRNAKETLDRIKSLGVTKAVATINESANRFDRPAGSRGALGLISPADEWLQDHSTVWEDVAGKKIIKNYRALIGSMSLLNSLYNLNADYCNSTNGVVYSGTAPIDLYEEGTEGHLENVSSSIRIQAYSLENGALSCPGTTAEPLVILPGGVEFGITQTQAFLPGEIEPESGARSDLGFWVTVKSFYDDHSGDTKDCSASALFTYPRLPADDAVMNDIVIDFPTPPGVATCQSTISSTVMRVLGPPGHEGKAMMLICRDASTSPSSTVGDRSCPTGPARTAFAAPDIKWKSCRDVTFCGQSATTVTKLTNQDMGGGVFRDGYELTFDNMPLNCSMGIEARLVDAAHNLSRTAASSTGVTTGQVPTPSCNSCNGGGYSAPPVGFCAPATRASTCTLNPPPPPCCGNGGNDGSTNDGGDAGSGANDGEDSGI